MNVSDSDARMIEFWTKAAVELKIEIMAPCSIELSNSVKIELLLFVKHFGADKGMLVASNHSVITNNSSEILKSGYGYSIFEGPSSRESYSKESIMAVLMDWGWSGDEKHKPSWLSKP